MAWQVREHLKGIDVRADPHFTHRLKLAFRRQVIEDRHRSLGLCQAQTTCEHIIDTTGRKRFASRDAIGADIVVTMDADGQHDPAEIERLVQPILNDQADFVLGSRLLGAREKDSQVRLVGIYTFNFILRLLTGVKFTDCSNGFRAFRLSELKKITLRQDQFHTTELIIEAVKKGGRITEVPVTVSRRLHGDSKKGRDLSYGYNFARTIVKTWFR